MLKTIISFCLSRRAIVVFGLLLFAGAGIFAFRALDIEAYPNPSPVVLEISAQSPGLAAKEMERYFTIPIENGLYTVPGINVIRSTSFYGLSFVRVAFNYGVDYDFAYAQTVIALQQNVNLPNGVTVNVAQNSGTGEIMRYQVVGPPHFGVTNLRTVQHWIVRRRLLQVHGIVAVNSWGGPTKEFEVDVDPDRLRSYGLTVPQAISALGNSNVNVGARDITIGQQSINIRGIGLIDDGGDDNIAQGYKVGDIENVVLSQQGGVPVLIRDVASVKVGYRPRLGIAGRDRADDIVFGIVVMGRTYQTGRVLPQVEAVVRKMNRDGSLPPGVRVVPFYDRSELVGLTTHTVMHNLVFGCLLVFLIQWLFLGDLRSAVIVGLTIPFALALAVIILVARGESANLLSLGAVDFGIIVDSAVIVMENIFRNLQRPVDERHTLLDRLAAGSWGTDPTRAADHATPVRGWNDRLRLILVSVMQVDRAVLFSVLIIVAAFVPLFTMQGVEGAIFGPMARTYAYALTGALIATFTVTPVLASIFLPERVEETETFMVRWLHRGYDAALRFALANRAVVIGCGLVFLAVGAFCWTRLGSEFLPHLDEGNLWIRAELPMTMTLQDGTAATRTMRLILLQYPEVVTVVSQHGRPDDGSDASPFSNVELNVPLKPPSQWPRGVTKDELIDQLQAKFEAALPGVSFNFSQYIQDNIEEAMSGVKGENSVKIIGPSLETLTALAAQVRDQMARVRGIADLGIFPVLGQPDLDITVNRAEAARYGLNTGDVSTVIQAALGGAVATEVLEGDRQFDLVVRYPRKARDTIRKIRNLEVAYQSGNGTVGYVPLAQLASINLTTGAAWIYHEAGERFIPVKFSVRGRDLGGAVAEAQARIASHLRLPPGYRLEWSGEYGELKDAQRRLEVIVPVSLVFILGLLYSLFNSIRESLLSLTGIPFAVAGGVLGLYITGRDFSISAAIGFISLFGVSVMIGILLLNRFRRARRRQLPPREAMFEAASGLMRPLLMMSLAAGIGLLPAAVSTGIGSEVQRPLATVVVGGMLFGTFLLLLVVPVLTMVLFGHGNEPERRP
ncbi:MAG TPA: CusA/CzcA family heavy metal efflux RND transporter [Steroidobacteraceae bacterium]|nr:CusA/CzcA family heavy metal efflux RND transporter [Steroidobacteraceae bacterium]